MLELLLPDRRGHALAASHFLGQHQQLHVLADLVGLLKLALQIGDPFLLLIAGDFELVELDFELGFLEHDLLDDGLLGLDLGFEGVELGTHERQLLVEVTVGAARLQLVLQLGDLLLGLV